MTAPSSFLGGRACNDQKIAFGDTFGDTFGDPLCGFTRKCRQDGRFKKGGGRIVKE